MRLEFYEVAGHYFDEPNDELFRTFGRIPVGYTGETDDLPMDSHTTFWLEPDEELVVGKTYGDFVVTEVLA